MRTCSDDLQQKFEEWYAQLQHEKFWAWLEESDNATHFKSKENLNFWSERPSQEHCNFLRTVWVEFGCPGHGKGPWDGLGATAKTKVTTDITDGNERTPTIARNVGASPMSEALHSMSAFSANAMGTVSSPPCTPHHSGMRKVISAWIKKLENHGCSALLEWP